MERDRRLWVLMFVLQLKFPAQRSQWLTGWGWVNTFRRLCEVPLLLFAGAYRVGAVAQLVERCNRTAEVRGSIPLSSIV